MIRIFYLSDKLYSSRFDKGGRAECLAFEDYDHPAVL